MSKRFSRLFLLVAMTAFAAAVQARVILRQNFDDTSVFQPGPLATEALDGLWTVSAVKADDFTITTEQAVSAPHALKALRQVADNGAGAAILHFKPAEGYDFTLECKVRCMAGDGTVLHLKTDDDKVFAGILLRPNASPSGYTTEGGWMVDKALPILPADQWFTCRVHFNASDRTYKIDIATADGEEHCGKIAYPVVVDDGCTRVHFINILPVGCLSYVDDIVVTQADEPAVDSRTLLNTKAFSTDAALAAVLAGQQDAVYAAKAGQGAVIEFSPGVDVNAFILKADGGAALPEVAVKALNTAGHWIDFGSLSADEQGFLVVPPTQNVARLTLDFAAPVALAACQIYSPMSAGQGKLDMDFAAKVDAEYRLPVYDLQYKGHERAQLTCVNHTEAVLPVVVTMLERGSGQSYGTPREVLLQPGENNIYYDLKGMPNGEYVTRVSDNSDPAAKNHGMLERLLRLRTSPPCSAVPWKEVTGQKLFFPDGFYLVDYKNVSFVPLVAEKHLVVRGVPQEDKWIYYGDDIFIDKEGHLRISYHTLNQQWQAASRKEFSAVALDDTMDRWESSEGAVEIPPQKRPTDESPLPPAAQPDWEPKPGPDGKIAYHFYDAEKDGPVQLNQIFLEGISPWPPGTPGYKEYDWKVLKPDVCTVWPVWYKAPGEAVILSRTPLVDTFPPSGALEPPNSGSDIGCREWLSDDGKTLFFSRARHLIRYMPYIARYDNLFDRDRIIAVWRTTDGLHWEQNYVAPPADNKPHSDQSYGNSHFRVPDGAGLRIAFFARYSAFTQQISAEILYTWDSFRWTRFQDKPPLLSNGPLGDWSHGMAFVNSKAVEKDGKYYQLMGWVLDFYHFQSEILNGAMPKELTADYMERYYGPRHLEEWPFFKEYFGGSWEKLAEHTRNATYSLGVMVYRKDGYFAATAEETPARLVTTPLTAKVALKANVVVDEGGFMKVRLLQNGRPLEGFTKKLSTCDDVAIPLFDTLPDGEFQVEITMKNARLYTLNF